MLNRKTFDTKWSASHAERAPSTQAPEGVRLGSAHTLQLEVGRAFTVIKLCWDSVALEKLDEASGDGAAAPAELAAVLLQPGLATVCIVSNGMSVVKARVEAHIPRRGNAFQLQVSGGNYGPIATYTRTPGLTPPHSVHTPYPQTRRTPRPHTH